MQTSDNARRMNQNQRYSGSPYGHEPGMNALMAFPGARTPQKPHYKSILEKIILQRYHPYGIQEVFKAFKVFV